MRKGKKKDIPRYLSICKLYKEGNYQKTKKFLFEYIEEYPKDILAQSLLSKTLIILKEYDEAEKVLKHIAEYTPDNIDMKIMLVKLYINKEDYLTAYQWYQTIDHRFLILSSEETIKDVYLLKYVLYHHLGIDFAINDSTSYGIRQVHSYDEESSISHICQRHLSEIGEYNDKDWSFYKGEEEIRSLYEKIKLRIEQGVTKNVEHDWADHYAFHIEKVGISKSQDSYTDTLYVITIKNSSDILTMYPVENSNNIIVNELDPKEEYISSKVRQRKSQIEKFNERYNIN